MHRTYIHAIWLIPLQQGRGRGAAAAAAAVESLWESAARARARARDIVTARCGPSLGNRKATISISAAFYDFSNPGCSATVCVPPFRIARYVTTTGT